METTHSDEHVSKFLKALLEIGGLYVVDDTPDKFIRNKVSGEVERISSGDKNAPLAIYGTYNGEALILNPFSEGESRSTQASWFFNNINICLAMNVLAMMTKLVELGVSQNKTTTKKKDAPDEPMLDMKIVNLLSSVAKDIDEKVLQELKIISKPCSNFFMIYYNKKTACTEVTSILTSEAKKKAFDSKTIRNKTWTILETLLMKLLGATDMEEFLYKPKTAMCRIFEGFSFTLTKVYSRLNEYAPLLIGKEFNTVELESHLRYFEQYAKTAYWCHGAMVFEERKHAPQAPQQPMPVTMMPASTMPGYNQPVLSGAPQMLTPPVNMPGAMNTPVMPMPGVMPPTQMMPAMPNIPLCTQGPATPLSDIVNENPFSRI